jgi:hypothetical protein
VEALNLDALEQLVAQARAAADLPDPGESFTTFVRSAALFQVEHEGLQTILLSEEVSPPASELRDELFRIAETALESAIRNGVVRPEITTSHLQRLVCSVEHAVRLGDGTDRDLLLDVTEPPGAAQHLQPRRRGPGEQQREAQEHRQRREPPQRELGQERELQRRQLEGLAFEDHNLASKIHLKDARVDHRSGRLDDGPHRLLGNEGFVVQALVMMDVLLSQKSGFAGHDLGFPPPLTGEGDEMVEVCPHRRDEELAVILFRGRARLQRDESRTRA